MSGGYQSKVRGKNLKRIIEWLKVRTMPIMLVACGIIYISFFDEQDIYGMANIKSMVADVMDKYGSDSEEASDKPDETDMSEAEMASEANDETVPEAGDKNSAETSEQITWRDPEDVVYETVTDDYFSDAVFIGDSRTVGMYEYGGLEDISTFYASTGLTVYKMFDANIVDIPGQKEKANIEQMLSEKHFSKIYLMIGINEMGTGTVDTFITKYSECLEYLRELQPDAIIYTQAIMKVTTERSEQGDYITNEGIDERNERLKELADNVNIYYLDVNPLICDESGGMISSYTSDGVHLKAKYIEIWKQFLMEHAVVAQP